VPYYTVQGGNMTLLNVTNTDRMNGKAVKLRFRGASNGDDVYNFTVFLSPGDVWTAELNQNPATGRARLVTTDTSCTLPTLVNGDFDTARLKPYSDIANETREGYLEIITVADLLPGSDVYTATKPVDGVLPRACSQGAVAPAALRALLNEAGIQAAGLGAPTTGLMSSWSIFNVGDALSWSGKAQAVVAVDGSGRPGAGQILMFPQTNDAPSRATNDLTADPLLRSGAVAIRNADLPDFSTPMLSQTTPVQQAAQLSGLWAKSSVQNEHTADDRIFGWTDWVLTFPTLRYSVALNHASGLLEYTELSPPYFTSSNTGVEGSLDSVRPARFDTRTLCLTNVNYRLWGRAGLPPSEAPVDQFWELVSRRWPCGMVYVMSINAGSASMPSALKASTSRKDLSRDFVEGWAEAAFFDINQAGIPVVGGAFARATSTNIGAGISGNFGLFWEHRYVRPDQVIR